MSNQLHVHSKAPRILVLLPVVGHPRDSKRVAMLKAAGFRVTINAFERNNFPGRLPDCQVNSLGRIEHGRYLKRCLSLIAAVPRVFRAIRESDCVYASGLDMALLGIVSRAWGIQALILEVGDIREIQVRPDIIGRTIRLIDRFIARRCSLIVVTSADFISDYYERKLGMEVPSLVIENKLDSRPERVVRESTRRLHDAPLRIGYFGVIRSPWSLAALIHLATSFPGRYEILVAGHSLDSSDLSASLKGRPGVTYLGPYKSPADLPSLYSQVDLVWACYPDPEQDSEEWRWAQQICRSNRFYECCAFGTPIISLAGSADAREVHNLDIGLVLNTTELAQVAQQLSSVTDEHIDRWRSKIANLPESSFCYSDEGDRLRREIIKGFNSAFIQI